MSDPITDPWADVRERLERDYMHPLLSGGPSIPQPELARKDVDRLLTDADALLAVERELTTQASVEYAEDVMDWDSTEPPKETFREWLEHEWPALAALPEHLRDQPDLS